MYFWPARFGQPRPLASGVGLGREVLGKQLVLRDGNALDFLGPLMLADDAVEAPVDEHAELGLMPPGHARRAGGGLHWPGLEWAEGLAGLVLRGKSMLRRSPR